MSFERGREPVSQLLSGEFGDGAANDLLKQFFDGLPVSNLRAALRSEDDEVVRRAAWLLSELGVKAAPLIDEVPRLLGHSDRTVRFWALDAVLVAGDPTCGEAFALAIQLVENSDEPGGTA